jgi:hypothetical protein
MGGVDLLSRRQLLDGPVGTSLQQLASREGAGEGLDHRVEEARGQ